MKKQDFKVLKTKDLYPFPDNPFHVAEDETLSELAESIKEFGIVTPIITRPKEDGDGYEVIAGQRRVRASELAGINTVPAFVLPLDREDKKADKKRKRIVPKAPVQMIISREYVGTQTVTEAFIPIISEDIRKKIAEGDTFDNEGLSA